MSNTINIRPYDEIVNLRLYCQYFLAQPDKGGATLDLTIFRGLAKIQEVTVLISDEWRMVIS